MMAGFPPLCLSLSLAERMKVQAVKAFGHAKVLSIVKQMAGEQ